MPVSLMTSSTTVDALKKKYHSFNAPTVEIKIGGTDIITGLTVQVKGYPQPSSSHPPVYPSTRHLVPEVPFPRKDHGHAKPVGRRDRFLIAQ